MKLFSCFYRNFSFCGKFAYDAEGRDAEGRGMTGHNAAADIAAEREKNSPAVTPANATDQASREAARRLTGGNAALNKMAALMPPKPDKYLSAWPKEPNSQNAPQNTSGFKNGEICIVNGNSVRLRNPDGSRAGLLEKGKTVTLAEPLTRIQVEDKIFIAVKSGDKKGFIAEKFLVRPESLYSEAPTKPQNKEEKIMSEAPAIERPKPGQQIHEYLAGNPLLQQYCEKFRVGIDVQLKGLQAKTRGTKLESHVNNLVRDFTANFDDTMLEIFETIGLRTNPEIVKRMLSNTKVPVIMLTGEKYNGNTLSVSGSALAEARPEENPPLIILSLNAGNGNYDLFKQAYIHESLHTYVEEMGTGSYTRSRIGEGITQMLTEMATGRELAEVNMKDQVAVAKVLFKANKDAVMDWYAGKIDDDAFQGRLKGKIDATALNKLFDLSKYHKNNNAIAENVVKATGISSPEDQKGAISVCLSYLEGRLNDNRLLERLEHYVTDTAKLNSISSKITTTKFADNLREQEAFRSLLASADTKSSQKTA